MTQKSKIQITIDLTEEEAFHFKEYKHSNRSCEEVYRVIKKVEKEVDKLKLK